MPNSNVEKFMTTKISRNDPCHCGSGKKYKKCCIKIDDEERAKGRLGATGVDKRFGHFDGDSELERITYKITWDPLIDEQTVLLSPQVEQLKAELHQQINDPKAVMQPIIEQLEGLCEQYPDDKTFGNYLAAAYLRHGDKEKGKRRIKDNFDRWPDYLFSKFQLADIYIEDGQFELLKELFEDKWDLKLLLPQRDVFHISEVRSMLYIAARYAHWIGNQAWFNQCYNFLMEHEPDCAELVRLMPLVLEARFKALMSGRKVNR